LTYASCFMRFIALFPPTQLNPNTGLSYFWIDIIKSLINLSAMLVQKAPRNMLGVALTKSSLIEVSISVLVVLVLASYMTGSTCLIVLLGLILPFDVSCRILLSQLHWHQGPRGKISAQTDQACREQGIRARNEI